MVFFAPRLENVYDQKWFKKIGKSYDGDQLANLECEVLYRLKQINGMSKHYKGKDIAKQTPIKIKGEGTNPNIKYNGDESWSKSGCLTHAPLAQTRPPF